MKWDKITAEDLDKIQGDLATFGSVLQKRYGEIDKEEVATWANRRYSHWTGNYAGYKEDAKPMSWPTRCFSSHELHKGVYVKARYEQRCSRQGACMVDRSTGWRAVKDRWKRRSQRENRDRGRCLKRNITVPNQPVSVRMQFHVIDYAIRAL